MEAQTNAKKTRTSGRKHGTRSKPMRKSSRTIAGITARGDHSDRNSNNSSARRLLRAWLNDQSGYDAQEWPKLKQALEDNRSNSNRSLYRD